MTRILCANLSSADEGIYQRLYEQASQERKARADRYRRREDALRCLAAEALLRYSLGTDCRMETAPGGKPFSPDRPDLHFNLSHSGNWAVIAWGEREVGVDVESIRPDTNVQALARRYFSPEEQLYVLKSETDRQRRFFEVWTGKESYVKYLGRGIQMDLKSFSILSLPQDLRLHRHTLPDGSLLCLCTPEEDCCLEFLDVRCL